MTFQIMALITTVAGCVLGLRSAVCLVTGGVIGLLACLGLFEFLARRVSAGIFRSIVG